MKLSIATVLIQGYDYMCKDKFSTVQRSISPSCIII